MGFGAIEALPRPSPPRMWWFEKKKTKNYCRPSQQPASLGIPAHIATGPLGYGAKLDLGDYPGGALHSIDFRQPVWLISWQA